MSELSLSKMPFDMIRLIISQFSVKKAYEFVEMLYLNNPENYGDLKEFGATVFNGELWEHFFKRDFPTAYSRALHFAPKKNTERTKITAEESEKQRAYWSEQYAALYKAAYSNLTPHQKQLFQLVARNDLESIKEGFKKNRFSWINLFEYDDAVTQTVLLKGSYSPIELARIKKHQQLLDVLYQIIYEEIYKKGNITKDSYGFTLLHWAAALNQTEICQNTNAYSINEKNNVGNTTLHLASLSGHLETVQLLIKNGAEIDVKNNDGNTPLHLACFDGHPEMVQLFIENSAELDIKNKNDNTPLHLACFNGHSTVVQLLIKNGAEMDVKNNAYKSPFHLACLNGHVEIVELLIKNGVKVDDTALDLACKNGHVEVARLLIQSDVKSDNEKFSRYRTILKLKNNELQTLQLSQFSPENTIYYDLGGGEGGWSDGPYSYGVNKWSILAEIAVSDDVQAIETLLGFSQFQTPTFIHQTVRTLEKAIGIYKKYSMDDRSLSIGALEDAKRLIIFQSEKQISNLNFNYTDEDKILLQSTWKGIINQSNSVDDLINVYEKFKNKGYISYRRHKTYDYIRSGFGLFNQSYPQRKILFIEQCQNRALELLKNSLNKAEEAQTLINSDLFAEQHLKHGVKAESRIKILKNYSKNHNLLLTK